MCRESVDLSSPVDVMIVERSGHVGSRALCVGRWPVAARGCYGHSPFKQI